MPKTSGQLAINHELIPKPRSPSQIPSVEANQMDIDQSQGLEITSTGQNSDYNPQKTRPLTYKKDELTPNDNLPQLTPTKAIEKLLSMQKNATDVFITPMYNKFNYLSPNTTKTSTTKTSLSSLPLTKETHYGKIPSYQLPTKEEQKECLDEKSTRNIPSCNPCTTPTHEPHGANNLHNTTIANEPCSSVMAGIRTDGLLPQLESTAGRSRHHDPTRKPELPCTNSDGGTENWARQCSKPSMAGLDQQPDASPNPPHLGDSPITMEQTPRSHPYCSYRFEHATPFVSRNHTPNSNTLPTPSSTQCQQSLQSNSQPKPMANSSCPKHNYNGGTKQSPSTCSNTDGRGGRRGRIIDSKASGVRHDKGPKDAGVQGKKRKKIHLTLPARLEEILDQYKNSSKPSGNLQ
ncbi:hypothetical protein A4A49_64317, partial [Nicotiana attenuata]